MAKPGRPSAGLDEYLYWQERLAGRDASGLSVDEFCDQQGVSRSTFYRWVRRLKDGIPAAVKEDGASLTLSEMAEPTDLRIFVCAAPTKMNLGFDRLMGMAQETFDQDPLSGHFFLFLNRQRDRIKILFWDVDGFCIWYKRLEAGTFQLPVPTEGEPDIELDCCGLNRLLYGLDLKNGRRRGRYRRVS